MGGWRGGWEAGGRPGFPCLAKEGWISAEFFMDVCMPPHHITVQMKDHPHPTKENRSLQIKTALPRATLSHGISLWVSLEDLSLCVHCGHLLGLADCGSHGDSWLIYVLPENGDGVGDLSSTFATEERKGGLRMPCFEALGARLSPDLGAWNAWILFLLC